MSLTNTIEGILPMSIYTVLKGEHEEVSGIFGMIQATPDMLKDAKEAQFNKLYIELLSHAKAEDTIVYSRLEKEVPEVDISHARSDHKKWKNC